MKKKEPKKNYLSKKTTNIKNKKTKLNSKNLKNLNLRESIYEKGKKFN